MPAETINLHIWSKCNLRCTYCYGRFPSRPTHLPLPDWYRIIDLIAAEGVRRVTFSGGEPTLHPGFEAMLIHARMRGLQTSIVTNGVRLTSRAVALLDMVAMTADSADRATLERLGRGHDYLDLLKSVVGHVHEHGRLLKINTVVTRLNAHEDLVALISELRPHKWKPLQFVHVRGENDAEAGSMEIDEPTFTTFVERHARLSTSTQVAPEPASVIRSTYVMVDPMGRVFQHSSGGHAVSAPVLDVGIAAALRQVGGYDRAAFMARGGHVDIRRLPVVQNGSSR